MQVRVSLVSGLASLLLWACSSLEPRPELRVEHALPIGDVTKLDELVGLAEQQHAGRSGFRLVREGPEAFAIRAESARVAGRSIDVQTYIWHEDLTGRFLALRLVEAADRGVKVRLLVDDMDARAKNYEFAALSAHPNIDVRFFNPFESRSGTFRFALEGLGSFDRINRRMHNKSWIVDNRIAVVGGRNLGDEYFGASREVNFVDLDFAMVGPIVRDASGSFDQYWNSPASYPAELLSPEHVTPAALEELRERGSSIRGDAERSPYAQELRHADAVTRLVRGDWPMEWADRYQFVADDPAKVRGEKAGLEASNVLTVLSPLLKQSTRNLTIISPYFVPGPDGARYLVDVDRSGSAVRVLTNSLAANDVAMVYGGYSKSRRKLLKGGVELWELRPTSGTPVKSTMFGSSGASLHTKALTADGQLAFVGSYNLDPRSTSLNCEQGIFVDSPVIAKELEQIFAYDTAGDRAWSVHLQDGEVRWSDGSKTYDSSPEAPAGRRFQAWLAQVLPIDAQL
jgi:putative cardiolipin synthase